MTIIISRHSKILQLKVIPVTNDDILYNKTIFTILYFYIWHVKKASLILAKKHILLKMETRRKIFSDTTCTTLCCLYS